MLCLTLAGCQAQAEVLQAGQPHVVLPAPSPAQPSEPTTPRRVSASPPKTGPSALVSPTAPSPAAAARVLARPAEETFASRRAFVDAIAAREVPRLTPDALISRFAPLLELEKSRPIPEALVVSGKTAKGEVYFVYSGDEDAAFWSGTVRLFASEAESAPVFKAVESHLRAKLGKPTRKSNPGESPQRDWKLVGPIGLYLSEMQGGDFGAADEREIKIEIGEPGGP